jgi:hypothetical protein
MASWLDSPGLMASSCKRGTAIFRPCQRICTIMSCSHASSGKRTRHPDAQLPEGSPTDPLLIGPNDPGATRAPRRSPGAGPLPAASPALPVSPHQSSPRESAGRRSSHAVTIGVTWKNTGAAPSRILLKRVPQIPKLVQTRHKGRARPREHFYPSPRPRMPFNRRRNSHKIGEPCPRIL